MRRYTMDDVLLTFAPGRLLMAQQPTAEGWQSLWPEGAAPVIHEARAEGLVVCDSIVGMRFIPWPQPPVLFYVMGIAWSAEQIAELDTASGRGEAG